MKIPKAFMLKGRSWEVEYIWNLMDFDPKDPDEVKCDGLCLFPERVIQLERAMPRSEKWPVFLHELVHAIIFESHISGLDGPAGKYLEEVICDSISSDFNELFNMKWKRRK